MEHFTEAQTSKWSSFVIFQRKTNRRSLFGRINFHTGGQCPNSSCDSAVLCKIAIKRLWTYSKEDDKKHNGSLALHLFLSLLEKTKSNFIEAEKSRISSSRYIERKQVTVQLEKLSLNAYFRASKWKKLSFDYSDRESDVSIEIKNYRQMNILFFSGKCCTVTPRW